MAKRKKPMNELPSILQPGMEVTVSADDIIESVTESTAITPSFENVTTTIPFIAGSPQSAGHQDEAHRIDMGSLTKERMRKVKSMRRGYIAADIRMEGGYEVKTNRDALFCFLDHLDI
jgi:hypothetical protein